MTHTIQVEDSLHFIPADESDLHSLIEPCHCLPTISSFRGYSPIWTEKHGTIKTFVIHNPTTSQGDAA